MHKHFAVAYIEGLGGLRKSCLIPTHDKQSNAANWLNISTAANMPVVLPLRNSNCGRKNIECSVVSCHYTITQMRMRPPNALISQLSEMYPIVTSWLNPLNILLHIQSFPDTFTLQWDEKWWHFFMHGNHVTDNFQVFAGMLCGIVSSLICSGKDNVV